MQYKRQRKTNKKNDSFKKVLEIATKMFAKDFSRNLSCRIFCFVLYYKEDFCEVGASYERFDHY